MKHDAPNHPKTRRLKTLVDVPLCTALGVLSGIWSLTAGFAPNGDIGKFSNNEISDWLEWPGDADELINALIESGWIDEDDEHRLVIHDWIDHCPEFIRKRIKRLPASDNGGQRQPVADNGSQCPPTSANGSITQPNPTQPNTTTPNPTADEGASESVEENPVDGPGDPSRWPYRSPEFLAAWERWLEHSENCLGRRIPTKTDAQLGELFRLKNEENALRWLEHSIQVSTKANLCDPATFSRGSPPGSEAHEVEQKRKAERDAAVERTQERRRKLRESRKKGRKSA